MIFPEPAQPIVVRGTTKLTDAARVAGHEVIYRCDDGLCGSCWHVSELTGDVYQLPPGEAADSYRVARCVESQDAATLPSKAGKAPFRSGTGRKCIVLAQGP